MLQFLASNVFSFVCDPKRCCGTADPEQWLRRRGPRWNRVSVGNNFEGYREGDYGVFLVGGQLYDCRGGKASRSPCTFPSGNPPIAITHGNLGMYVLLTDGTQITPQNAAELPWEWFTVEKSSYLLYQGGSIQTHRWIGEYEGVEVLPNPLRCLYQEDYFVVGDIGEEAEFIYGYGHTEYVCVGVSGRIWRSAWSLARGNHFAPVEE